MELDKFALMPVVGHVYRVERETYSYRLSLLRDDPLTVVPERLTTYFSLVSYFSFSAELPHPAPEPAAPPRREYSGVHGRIRGYGTRNDEPYALVELRGNSGTREKIQSAPLDGELERSPDDKGAYVLRPGDLIRRGDLEFVVRRIVPPDAERKHIGWVDVENLKGMFLEPAKP